jgi:hypothetical protein
MKLMSSEGDNSKIVPAGLLEKRGPRPTNPEVGAYKRSPTRLAFRIERLNSCFFRFDVCVGRALPMLAPPSDWTKS